MKNCANCVHDMKLITEKPCNFCIRGLGYTDNWDSQVFEEETNPEPCASCHPGIMYLGWESLAGGMSPAAARVAEIEADNFRLREALTEIRDLARTGLKPDVYPTEEYWLSHKVNKIAGMANAALQPPEAE